MDGHQLRFIYLVQIVCKKSLTASNHIKDMMQLFVTPSVVAKNVLLF